MAAEVVSRTKPRARIFTRSFFLLCSAQFFCYSHLGFMTPTLPLYIQEHGGTASFVGLVSAAFSVAAFLVRPLIGYAIDVRSLRGVMGWSTAGLGFAGLGYLVYHPMSMLAVSALNGVTWAGYNTAANTLLSRVAPAERRGEAAGYLMTSQGIARSLVPALALWLLGLVSYAGVFVATAVTGLFATVSVLAMGGEGQREAGAKGGSFWRGLMELTAVVPSSLEGLTKLGQPAVMIFVPLYATFRGIAIESLSYYFVAYGVVLVATQIVLGYWSDRLGRASAIAVGACLTSLGLVVISQATDIVTLTAGGVLFALGLSGTTSPVMALVIDVSPPEKRGSAMATYSMVFQISQGFGALLIGALIETVGYQTMYLVLALSPVAALAIVLTKYRSRVVGGESG